MRLQWRVLSDAFVLTAIMVLWGSGAYADVLPVLQVYDREFSFLPLEVKIAAEDGREILPQIAINDAHAQELGFGSLAETSPAETSLPQKPFVVFEVGLEPLQTFSPGVNPQALLQFTNQLLFPITVGHSPPPRPVRSSLTVRHLPKEKIGRVTRWGSRNLITQLTNRRDGLPSRTRSFLVQVPALNRDFLGYLQGPQLKQIKLVPLVKDHLFEAGAQLSASEVFMKLSGEARTVDGSPR